MHVAFVQFDPPLPEVEIAAIWDREGMTPALRALLDVAIARQPLDRPATPRPASDEFAAVPVAGEPRDPRASGGARTGP